MSPVTRRLLLAVPISLLVLIAAAYLLVNTWLESAGGRQAVERALQERIGLPVRLQGDFNVMLLPAIGVSGTALVVGEAGPESEFLRSQDYAISLAVAPLLDHRLLIESLRFGGGALHLERWPESVGTGVPADVRWPEIGRLEIQDFRIFTAEGGGQPYLLQKLMIEGFAVDTASQFRLEVRDYGVWVGSLTWIAERSELDLTAVGTGFWSGQIQLRADLSPGDGTGAVEAEWIGGPMESGSGHGVQLSVDYAVASAGLRIRIIRFALDRLMIEGSGCLLTTDRPELNLDLVSERVDVDSLPDLSMLAWPEDNSDEVGIAQQEPASDDWLGLDFRVRLTVAELLAGGAVARQAVLQLGAEPDCAGLEAATAN